MNVTLCGQLRPKKPSYVTRTAKSVELLFVAFINKIIVIVIVIVYTMQCFLFYVWEKKSSHVTRQQYVSSYGNCNRVTGTRFELYGNSVAVTVTRKRKYETFVVNFSSSDLVMQICKFVC